jgi:hypothetical protein
MIFFQPRDAREPFGIPRRRSDPGHAGCRTILIEFLSQETAMNVTKALIVIAALALATFMIGVGKYNAQYADARHGFTSHHAA